MTRSYRKTRGALEVVADLGGFTGSPLAAMIEVADRCNETCLHCYQIQGQKGEMTTEQIFGMLDALAAQGVLFLTISGGEATLRSDFLEIVAYARRLKFAVKVYSNGLRMTRELSQALADLAVQEVQMSLYSPRPEVHDEVTCVPGSFAKTTDGARHLVAAGVPVVLKTPLMKFNEGDHGSYIALCEEIGADYLFDVSLMSREDGDRAPLAMAAGPDQLTTVLSDARVVSEVDQKRVEAAPMDSAVCGACVGSYHVEANGEIRPCAALSVSVGNVLEGGLQASRVNPEAKFIRGLTWGSLHGCRDCELRAHCSRCYETARSDGDALGPYESACTRAVTRWSIATGRDVAIADLPRRLGPFQVSDEGLVALADELTPEDLAARAAHPWITERAKDVAPSKDLVQIRRRAGGAIATKAVDRSGGGSTVSSSTP